MDIYEVNFTQAVERATTLASEHKDGLLVIVSDKLGLATGRTADTYSEAVRQEYNIPIFHSEYIGGTIVVFPDDISFLELSLSYSDFGEQVVNAVKDYLLSVGLKVRNFGNDLMLYSDEENEWFKVASYGSGWISKGYMQTVIHISIGMDEELVDRICTKPCKKKPRGLSRYGITAQAIYNAIKPTIDRGTK